MARFLTLPEDESREVLAAAGVRLDRVIGDEVPALVADVLPEGQREVRAEADIEVPEDIDAGMGAWHVNAVDEVHVVASGAGVMEFVTIEGPVGVLVEAGDVIAIRGAEHRYRPLTPQRWVLRFGGPADGDLGATETGRAAGPWPLP
jgi:mannose-6-phosphate isomerase-like protein (cupin superfamily)